MRKPCLCLGTTDWHDPTNVMRNEPPNCTRLHSTD
jgi:hypothetical protein